MPAITQEMHAKLEKVIERNRGQRGAVMMTLQQAQDIYGHVPKDVQIKIAEGLGVTLSEVYGVVTFYSQFSLDPSGEYIIGVCMGTACYVQNAQEILDKVVSEIDTAVGKTSADGLFTIRDTRCLGCCGLAPVMMINEDVYGRLSSKEIPDILKKYKNA